VGERSQVRDTTLAVGKTLKRKKNQRIYGKIPEECLPLHFVCILKTTSLFLANEQYTALMDGQARKISELLQSIMYLNTSCL